MIESVFQFILLCLATFRLTRLIVFDNITRFIRRPFHEEYEETLEDGMVETYIKMKGTGIRRFIGELLSCYWCVGIWCAIILYMGYLFIPTFANPVIIILSIAGTASLIETIVLKIID